MTTNGRFNNFVKILCFDRPESQAVSGGQKLYTQAGPG
jgi:hypothetical protein